MIHRSLFILLGFSCFVGAATTFMANPVFAQESAGAITVIRKDGAIQSLEIPKQPKATSQNTMSGLDLLQQMEAAIAKESAAPAQIEVHQNIPGVPEVILKERKRLPIPAEAIPLEEPKINAPVKIKKPVIPAVKKTIKKTPLKSNVPSKVTTHKYAKTLVAPPLPNAKPLKSKVTVPVSRALDYTNLPDNVMIDSDTALRIALEYAPPARSFTVHEGRQYQGKSVYQVTFKTENGAHDVLIDSTNGDVLKK
jgi:uncharacterized membrane protein YkoI